MPDKNNKLIQELEIGEQSKMISAFDPKKHLQELQKKYYIKAGL